MAGINKFNYYCRDSSYKFHFILWNNNVIKYISPEITPPGTGAQSYTPASPVTYEAGWSIGAYADVAFPIAWKIDETYNFFYKTGITTTPSVNDTISFTNIPGRMYSMNGEVNGDIVVGNPAVQQTADDNGPGDFVMKDVNNNTLAPAPDATGCLFGFLGKGIIPSVRNC